MTSTKNQTDAVDRAYARALFELAEQAGTLDAMAEEAEQLAGLIAQQADLRRLLGSRALGHAQHEQMLERLFAGRVSDAMHRFLRVVNRKGRLGSLAAMLYAFGELVNEQRGLVEVDAFVAHRLDEAQQRQVAEAVGQRLGKEVVLHQYVDPELIGGIRLRVGDQVIDASIATQLRLLKRRMIAAGRERARRSQES